MQNQLTFLHSYYENDKKNNFIIEVSLDSYTDIFNEYDPSPFKKRDLNPDLLEYLDDCSNDIPVKYPIIIQFNIPKNIHDKSQENKIIDGFKTYYSFTSYSAKKEYNNLLIQNFKNVLIAIFLLLLGLTLEFHSKLLIKMLSNIIIIGGWVFLWEAITQIFFERRSLKEKYLVYKRFNMAAITFNLV